MRKLLACALALLGLAGCAREGAPPAETTAEPETTYIKIFDRKDEGDCITITWETDFDDSWANSAYVVHATVSEIGESYLYDGSQISAFDSESGIREKMKKIFTPVTLTVIEDFKGVLAQGDKLILSEFWGEMNGYLIKDSNYTLPKLGEEYIFFVDHRESLMPETTGEFVNLAWTQMSIHVNADGEKDFEPLFNEALYAPYANSNEIIAAIRALGAAS